MEKRVILAIVLSFLVIFLYQAIFLKNKTPAAGPVTDKPLVQKTEAGKPGGEVGQLPAKTPQAGAAAAQVEALEEIRAGIEERIIIDTSLYRAVWSNRGAVLQSWRLKKLKDEKKEDLEIVPFFSQETGRYPFLVQTGDAAWDEVVNTALFKASAGNLTLKDGQKNSLKFEFSDGKNLKIEKAMTFEGGKYDFSLKIRILLNGREIEPRLFWGPGIGNNALAQKRQISGGARGISVLIGNKVLRMSEGKYRAEQAAYNFIDWAAYEDNYTAALFFTPPLKGSASYILEMKDKTPLFFLAVSAPQRVFIGPKEMDTLRKLHPTAKKLINFGFFGIIAEILLVALKLLYKLAPNWGVSIILLTLVTKILFFPLTYSSTKSMAKMQEIQPKLKALRAKYKKAKRDIAERRMMNEEMMKLYKEHGINPAGGCLPILIQLPFFWGIFRILTVAVELRHAPFVFWIQDLSVRDPYYITPILMGVTQFISQKMTPTGADPAQAKIMLIMPFMMTFLFVNFQSGLVLFWLTSNVLQIGQQYIMNRMMQKKKREAHGKRREK